MCAGTTSELCSCCVAGTGELRYAWSNVCMHYFSTAFLVAMADHLKQQGQYHIAHKKIPSKQGPVQVTDCILHIHIYTCTLAHTRTPLHANTHAPADAHAHTHIYV